MINITFEKNKKSNKKNAKGKTHKRMETSKKLVWFSWLVAIILTLLVIVCTLFNVDCTNITTIAGYSWAEVAAANIFYYTMVKRLNAPKVIMNIYNDLPDKLKEQVDINNLLSNLMN